MSDSDDPVEPDRDGGADEPSGGGDANTAAGRRVRRENRRGLLSFRNIALVSILIVAGAVGFEVWRNPELVGASRFARAPNVDATPAGEQLRVSERYQDNLRRQNIEGAEQAQREGESFIAVPDEPLRQIDDVPTVVTANPNRPLPPANPSPEPETPQTVVIERQPGAQPTPTGPPPPDYTRINQLAQLMAAQQQGLLGAWAVQPSAVTVVVEQELLPAEAEDEPLSAMPNGALGPAPLTQPAIRAGDVVLASTIITNDSDTPGPVVAELRAGPLRGARLVGGFEPNQNNTHLIVQFDRAVLEDGTQVPVAAYAVDPRQTSLAVRTDIDRRLLARYAPRVAAAFVSGLGEALSDPGSTLVDLGGGVAGIERPAATFEQGLYQGLADVGNDLAGEFVQSAPSGPLISLRSRQVIGVLFLSNVEQPGG